MLGLKEAGWEGIDHPDSLCEHMFACVGTDKELRAAGAGMGAGAREEKKQVEERKRAPAAIEQRQLF
jgi:hypothetical protein